MRTIDADDLDTEIVACSAIAQAYLDGHHRPVMSLLAKIVYEGVREKIKNAPTIEAEPVRHGTWETDSCPMDDGEYLMERCTACGTAIEYGMGTPYCPFCGAKMDGGEE